MGLRFNEFAPLAVFISRSLMLILWLSPKQIRCPERSYGYTLRRLDEDDFNENKGAAKERRLKLCGAIDSKALVLFPAANLLFNTVYWAYFLS